jgi:hypothetical protein
MSHNKEESRFWDVRTLDRRVRKGQVTRKDVEKHLKSLPDVESKGEMARVEAGPSPDDDADLS